MGQYFKLVNVDKKEVVHPWDIGGGAKFFEWLYNRQARVLVWLLRQSDSAGGGDIPVGERGHYITLGRWARDRVTLIGDYDSSRLWRASETKDGDDVPLPYSEYTDISSILRKEFNEAVIRDRGSGGELL
jgi:hypothetical protein